MKVTANRIKQNVSAANANSRHLPIGLQYHHNPKGHHIKIVNRKTGMVMVTWENISASEANIAVSVFNHTATLIKGEHYDEHTSETNSETGNNPEADHDSATA